MVRALGQLPAFDPEYDPLAEASVVALKDHAPVQTLVLVQVRDGVAVDGLVAHVPVLVWATDWAEVAVELAHHSGSLLIGHAE